MNATIRRVAYLMVALMAILMVRVTWIELVESPQWQANPYNQRTRAYRDTIKRGSILTRPGPNQTILAASQPDPTSPTPRFTRVYNQGPVYAPITGFIPYEGIPQQLERVANDPLMAKSNTVPLQTLVDQLKGLPPVGNHVITTIDPTLQMAAYQGLEQYTGAAVVMDATNGDVLALVSTPSYDPGVLTSRDVAEVSRVHTELQLAPGKPLLNKATSELYPPGSTFKVITSAAWLAHGGAPGDIFEDPKSVPLPGSTARIHNFSRGRSCTSGSTLSLDEALRVSCNTTFALMAQKMGGSALINEAQAFGFNAPVPFALPAATPRIPTAMDAPATMMSAIGQRDVQTSPLHMAMVAATIANHGVMMQPRIIGDIVDPAGRTITASAPPSVIPNPMTGQTSIISHEHAQAIATMMRHVVEFGTAKAANIPQLPISGKTGTANRGQDSIADSWFIGFAPVGDTTIALAVMVEHGGAGGGKATKIARDIFLAAHQELHQ